MAVSWQCCGSVVAVLWQCYDRLWQCCGSVM